MTDISADLALADSEARASRERERFEAFISASDDFTHWQLWCAALAPAVPQWMPVETAPKDGTMFLGWVAAERWTGLDGECSSGAHDTSQVDFCWWRNAPEHPAPEAYNGGHYENASGQVGDGQDITHWMPLPAAPSAKEPTCPKN